MNFNVRQMKNKYQNYFYIIIQGLEHQKYVYNELDRDNIKWRFGNRMIETKHSSYGSKYPILIICENRRCSWTSYMGHNKNKELKELIIKL